MQTATLSVSGMRCDGFVRGVSGVLNALDRVAMAYVSLDKQCAVVNYDAAKVDLGQLGRAAEEAGY